tara:strand:- start:22854 stop:24122 length:1269 start_codon:yes stop_codon:yes gene_type:complete
MNSITLNNILQRNELKNTIIEFINGFYDNTDDLTRYRGMYIYGETGIGKTRFIKDILVDYDVIYYDAGNIRNKSVINNITKHNMSNNNVLSLFHSKKKKIVIVMDEIENMNQGDKGGINLLLKMIRSKKTKKQRTEEISSIPIICLGTYQNDKKMNELKKICLTCVIKSPTKPQIQELIKLYFPKLNNSIKIKLLNKIVNLNQLQMYIQMYHSNISFIDVIINNDMTLNDIVNTDTKIMTQKLLSNRQTILSHSSINETDRTIIALLLHENIIDLFDKHKIVDTMPLYLKILENICFADYVDRITFQRQIWQFNEMSSLLKNIYTSYLLNEYQTKLKDIRFTKILTKYSTEYNNKLFIQNLTQALMMDKKDLICYIYNLLHTENRNDENILLEIENINVSKLDINRIIRYIEYVYTINLNPL